MAEQGRTDAGPRQVWIAMAIDAALAALLFGMHWALFGRADLNPSDEGFLWYGLERMGAGDVPLRDFQSYEPGRYWWCLAFWSLFGEGVLQMRVAILAFGALGLYSGLRVLRRVIGNGLVVSWQLVPAALILMAWFFPRHKLFECALSLMAVHASLWLFERPTFRRHLITGVFVGLAACIGRNHGLYAFLGILAAIVLRVRKAGSEQTEGQEGRSGLWAVVHPYLIGVVVGFSPVVVMLATVDGFAAAFFDSLVYFVRKGTNHPLPWPWPWRLGFEHVSTFGRLAIGFAFLLPVIVLVAAAVALWRARWEDRARWAPLAAASTLGLFYIHQASVRSDPAHLAQAFHPLLLAFLSLPALWPGASALKRGVGWGLLLLVSLAAAPWVHPLVRQSPYGSQPRDLVPLDVRGQELQVAPEVASMFQGVRQVLDGYAAGQQEVLIAPYFPTLYPYCQRRSPAWSIYFLWEEDPERQQETIARMDRNGLRTALIFDTILDGRQETHFSRTNPLIWAWLQREFERVQVPGMPPTLHLMQR